MHRLPRLAHAPVAVARRRERDLGGALSLAQLKTLPSIDLCADLPPLSRRDVNPRRDVAVGSDRASDQCLIAAPPLLLHSSTHAAMVG